jgi:CHAT domain-containing protein/tetratricopeptide (TPR) repeat protein
MNRKKIKSALIIFFTGILLLVWITDLPVSSQALHNTETSIIRADQDSAGLYKMMIKADSFYYAVKYDSALFFYEKAENTFLEGHFTDTSALIKINERIGTISFELRQIDKASKAFVKTFELSKMYYGTKSFECARSFINLSTIILYYQKYDDAFAYLEKALEIYQTDTLHYKKELAKVTSNLSCAYRGIGRFKEAFETINLSIRYLNSLPENYEKNILLFKAYINLGNIYSNICLYKKALDAYNKALNLRTKLKPSDDRTILILYNNIGVVYLESGDFKNLLNSSTDAYNLCKSTGSEDKRMLINSLNGIGVASMCLGEDDKAGMYFNKAFHIAGLQSNNVNLENSNLYQNFGNLYRKLGQYDSARICYNKSLSIMLKLAGEYHLNNAILYKNIGELFIDQKQTDSALVYYHKSKLIYDSVDIKPNIKYLDLLYDLAESNFIKVRYNETDKFLNLLDLKLKEFEDNIAPTDAITISLLKIKNRIYKLKFLTSLVLARQDNYYYDLDKTRAIQLLKDSRDKILIYELADSLLKEKYEKLKEEIYFNKLSLNIASEKGKIDDAVQLTLKNKSLNDSLHKLCEMVLNTKSQLLYDRDNSFLAKKVKSQLLEKQTFICYMLFGDTLWINLINKKKYVILKVKVDEDFTLYINNFLTLLSGNDKDIYLVKRHSKVSLYFKEQFVSNLGAKTFAKYIFDGKNPINEQLRSAYLDSLSQYFYKILIEPVADQLEENSQLIIVPDQKLDILPFASLYRKVKGENECLVDKFDILYTNSLSVYFDKLERKKLYISEKRKELLGIAISKYPSVDDRDYEVQSERKEIPANALLSDRQKRLGLSNLEYTRQEIESIIKSYKTGTYNILFDSAATEKQVGIMNKQDELSQYKIIHFATHGYLKDVEIFGGSLAMYDSKLSGPVLESGYDGFLSFFEIIKLNLRSDLVVLSACNSGQGMYIEGEGVCGLNYAFYLAGANYIISSLWEIDDKITAAIFSEFYARVQSGESYCKAINNISRLFIAHNNKTSPKIKILTDVFAEALQSKNYFPPYYWAAFTMW